MPFSIPKINVGKSKNKVNKFTMPMDVNTTADFGSIQPLMSRLLVPGTKMTLNLKNALVRMGTMPVPTFGRMSYNIYNTFVPLSDIYKPFDNLLSESSFHGKTKDYIPTNLPYCSLSSLSSLFISGCHASIYSTTTAPVSSGANWKFSDLTLVTDSSVATTAGNLIGKLYSCYIIPESSEDSLCSPSTADMVLVYQSTSVNYIACLKFKNGLKRLRKILLGLGYRIDIKSTRKVSVLPLLALYKSWFDLFAPKVTSSGIVNWTSTNAYKLMDCIVQEDLYNLDNIFGDTKSDVWTYFSEFWDDLKNELWYYQGADFISSHILNPSLGSAASGSPSVSTYYKNIILGSGDDNVHLSANQQPFYSPDVSGSLDDDQNVVGNATINPLSLKLLLKMLPYVNKNTIIGGRIRDYIKVHYGAAALQEVESNFIGAAHVDCNVGGIFSTSETDQAVLGQYAGVGLGKLENKKWSYKASTFGYWITFACVVPDAGRCQGVDPTLSALDKWSLYTPELDGLGYDLTAKDVVCGNMPVQWTTKLNSPSLSGFGYIPRYSMFKVAQNLVNGDLSLPSQFASLGSYYLDNIVTEPHFVDGAASSSGSFDSYFVPNQLPVASPEYRAIGRNPWLGNFDRIFTQGASLSDYDEIQIGHSVADEAYLDDNFIINNEFEITMYSPMLSISDSFDTDSNGDHYSLSHE